MSGVTAVLIFIISISLIITLTVKFRVNAVIVMLGVSIISGLCSGMPLADIANTVRNGFGSTLGYIGIVILEGMMIGTILEKSGALSAVTGALLKKTGSKRSVLAMSVTGYAASIPVSCDSAYVLLSPVVNSVAEVSGKSLAVISVAMSTGLYVTHCLVPPTPGPVSSMGILNANPLLVTLLGLIVSVPGVAAGYFWAVKFVGRSRFTPQYGVTAGKIVSTFPGQHAVSIAILPLAVPLLFMALRSLAIMPFRPFGSGLVSNIIIFCGDPVVSLFAGFLCALIPVRREFLRDALGEWMTEAIRRSAPVIAAAGAGGAFGAVIKGSSIINSLVTLMYGWQIGILLPFIIAAALKTATGSSTISIITTSSVVAPMAATLGINPSLAVLAIGSGAMMVSHVNDPYFWIVSKLSGMDEASAFRFFTPATGVTSVATFIPVALLSFFIK